MIDSSGGDQAAARPVATHAELFLSFTKIALSGFGGTMAWAHREIVHNKSWMSEEEFTEMLSISQFVPGPNIANVAIYVGGRFHRWSGAIAAELGLMWGPVAILIGLGMLYDRYGALPSVSGALAGVTAAAMGMFVAMGISMLKPLRRHPIDLAFVAATFIGVSVLDESLLTTILVLAPISIAYAWLRRI